MDKSDSQNDRDDPTSRTGPQESSGAMRKWLDNFFTPGEAGSEPPADPIARNPKDTGRPDEAAQPAQVRRRSEVLGPADGVTRRSDLTGGFHPHPAPPMMDLLASVLRFKWTVLIVWILVSAPIIAAIWTQIVPKYEARAVIQVRPNLPRLVFKTEENSPVSGYDSFMNTQVSVVTRQAVLKTVLDQRDVQETQWFKNRATTLIERLNPDTTPPEQRLRAGLSVRPRPRTEIIDLSFSTRKPSEAQLILKKVLDGYTNYVAGRSNDEETNLLRQLGEQYTTQQQVVQGIEKSCAELCAKLGTDTPQALVSAKRMRLDTAQAQLDELRAKIQLLERDVNEVKAKDSNGVEPGSTAEVAQRVRRYEDAEWRKLNTDVNNIQRQMDIYTPEHPARKRLKKELDFAEGLRKARETQLDELWRDHQKKAGMVSFRVADANSSSPMNEPLPPQRELARAQYEKSLLTKGVEGLANDLKSAIEDAQKFEAENRRLREARELLDAFRQRKEQKETEQAVRKVVASIETIMDAYSPARPANDRRVIFTIMALMAGLGLGGGAGFLRASRNQTIYAPQDMPQPARVPLLGCMPLIHLEKPVGEALSKEIEQKQGALIESVRVLRTALLNRLDGHGHTTVVVTSANRGTGKSSVTLVLGKSIAQAGRRVLLIDADFHRMGLSKRLNMVNRPGFRESLKDGTAEGLHVFPTGTAGLDVMPAGLRGKDNSVFDEIAHDAFKNWLGQLFERHGYQIVLLDTPPLLPVADAAILAGQADATILVEREHVSRRAEVVSALLRLGSAGGRLLGTVFVGSATDDRYGYGYGYGYHGGTREP